MPHFTMSAHCRGSAEEIWRLLYDPYRFPEWWAGTARIDEVTRDPAVRFMDGWPDFPQTTGVIRRDDGPGVLISCLLSEIVHECTLESAEAGCVVSVRVEVPETEAPRLARVREELTASLPRLVAAAESA